MNIVRVKDEYFTVPVKMIEIDGRKFQVDKVLDMFDNLYNSDFDIFSVTDTHLLDHLINIEVAKLDNCVLTKGKRFKEYDDALYEVIGNYFDE